MAFTPGTLPPKSIPELKSLIVSGKITLPGKPAVLAKAMLERPDCAAFESAGSVASRCGVSQSTAYRLTRLLSCSPLQYAGIEKSSPGRPGVAFRVDASWGKQEARSNKRRLIML